MGRINHYQAYVLAKRDGMSPEKIAEQFNATRPAINAVIRNETWERRHLKDPFSYTVKDEMVDRYSDRFNVDYRNGVTKLYHILCRHFHISQELTEESQKELLDKVGTLKDYDIPRLPGISKSFAMVLEQMVKDVREGLFVRSA